MTTTAESRFTGLFDQAVQAFGDAMKAGVKMQEDVTRWWSDILDQGSAVNTWQKRSRAIASEAIPAAQRNAEEWLKLMDQNYKRSMELLKKAMDAEQTGVTADVRAKSQELWEATLEVIRDNAQATAQANMKIMEQWTELLRRNMNGGAATSA